MPTGNIYGSVQTLASLGGDSGSTSFAPVGPTLMKASAVLPAGLAATLTTRTSDTVGIFTTAIPHGLAGTETLCIFWPAGKAIPCSITAHDSLTFTILAAGGDALPDKDTVCIASVAQEIVNNFAFTGADLQQLLVTALQPGVADIQSTGPVSRLQAVISATAPYYSWPTVQGQAVPFSQAVVMVYMYNNSLVASEMKVNALCA